LDKEFYFEQRLDSRINSSCVGNVDRKALHLSEQQLHQSQSETVQTIAGLRHGKPKKVGEGYVSVRVALFDRSSQQLTEEVANAAFDDAMFNDGITRVNIKWSEQVHLSYDDSLVFAFVRCNIRDEEVIEALVRLDEDKVVYMDSHRSFRNSIYDGCECDFHWEFDVIAIIDSELNKRCCCSAARVVAFDE
jgi:hypothetical protein